MLGIFDYPTAIAVDRAGNLFVTQAHEPTIMEIPLRNGSYSTSIILPEGQLGILAQSISLDAAGNVYVANHGELYDPGEGIVEQIPFGRGNYGSPVIVGRFPYTYAGVAVGTSGTAFIFNYDNYGGFMEAPYSNGTYSTPVSLGPAFSNTGWPSLSNPVIDAVGNIFAVDFTNEVKEFTYSGGSYGPAFALASGFKSAPYLADDSTGNIFIVDNDNSTIEKIPSSNGHGTPINLDSGFDGLALDASGNVFVLNSANSSVGEIPFSDDSYGAPIAVGMGLQAPSQPAVDAVGNVFVIDSGNVKEIPFNNGIYGNAITVVTGLHHPQRVIVDAAEDLFVADAGDNAVKEIPFDGTPTVRP